MTLTPNDFAIIGVVVITAIIVAVQDDPRWLRWLRRRWNRSRAWKALGRGMPPSRPVNYERASNEWRVDQPTRNVP